MQFKQLLKVDIESLVSSCILSHRSGFIRVIYIEGTALYANLKIFCFGEALTVHRKGQASGSCFVHTKRNALGGGKEISLYKCLCSGIRSSGHFDLVVILNDQDIFPVCGQRILAVELLLGVTASEVSLGGPHQLICCGITDLYLTCIFNQRCIVIEDRESKFCGRTVVIHICHTDRTEA